MDQFPSAIWIASSKSSKRRRFFRAFVSQLPYNGCVAEPISETVEVRIHAPAEGMRLTKLSGKREGRM